MGGALAAPVTRTVDSLGDVTDGFDGVTTLREAIAASDSGDTVDFALGLGGKTVSLTGGQIEITKSITITSGILVSVGVAPAKDHPSRIFRIADGVGLTLSRLVCSDGSAVDGGAIYNGVASQLICNSCRFVNNTASEHGGALHNEGGAVTLNASEFVGNTAGRGGAVSNRANGFMEIGDGLFEDNAASGLAEFIYGGGGVFSIESDTYIARCRFIGNSSAKHGLCFSVGRDGLFSVVDSVIAGSEYTGESIQPTAAIHLLDPADFRDCSIQGNAGGGINAQSAGLTRLANCTIGGNGGRGLRAHDSHFALTNCLLWSNSVNGIADLPGASIQLVGTATASYSHCLLQAHDLTGSGDGNLDGTDPANDPGFRVPIDPATVPTSAGDLTPGLFSAAVDAGDDAVGGVGNTDAAGNARVVGEGIDLGAFEMQQKVIHVDVNTIAPPADGRSWGTAFPTLGDAIAASSPGDVLHLAAGVYAPDIGVGRSKNDVTARFDIDHALELLGGFPNGGGARDPEANPTVVSGELGDGLRSQVLFVVDPGEGGEVVFDGLEITRADGRGDLPIDRGGISANSGSIAVVDCTFGDNFGAVKGRDSTVSFRRCVIADNEGAPSRVLDFFRSEVSYTNTRIIANRGDFYHNGGTVIATNVELGGNDGTVELLGDAFGTIINGTVAGNDQIPFVLSGGSTAAFINTIIWNNRIGGVPQVWVRGDGPADFSHCIVEGMDLTDVGAGNFDGTDPISIPAFIFAARASDAPTVGGVYSLSIGSPAGNAGDPMANPEPFDLAGRERAPGGAINLGAYQRIFAPFDEDEDRLPDWWEFAHSDPQEVGALNPQADDDGDGLINIAEFVHGLDPNVANVPDDYLRMLIVEDDGGEHLALGVQVAPGIAGTDWFVEVERSTDLGDEDPWSTLGTARFPEADLRFERVYRSQFDYGSLMAEFLRATIRQAD